MKLSVRRIGAVQESHGLTPRNGVERGEGTCGGAAGDAATDRPLHRVGVAGVARYVRKMLNGRVGAGFASQLPQATYQVSARAGCSHRVAGVAANQTFTVRPAQGIVGPATAGNVGKGASVPVARLGCAVRPIEERQHLRHRARVVRRERCRAGARSNAVAHRPIYRHRVVGVGGDITEFPLCRGGSGSTGLAGVVGGGSTGGIAARADEVDQVGGALQHADDIVSRIGSRNLGTGAAAVPSHLVPQRGTVVGQQVGRILLGNDVNRVVPGRYRDAGVQVLQDLCEQARSAGGIGVELVVTVDDAGETAVTTDGENVVLILVASDVGRADKAGGGRRGDQGTGQDDYGQEQCEQFFAGHTEDLLQRIKLRSGHVNYVK